MNIAYNTFTPTVLASARPVNKIVNRLLPIPASTNYGLLNKSHINYTGNYNKKVYSDTHNTNDFVYSGVYIVNTLTPNSIEGNVFDFGTFSDDVTLSAYLWNATLQKQSVKHQSYAGHLDGVSINYNSNTLQKTEQQTITVIALSGGDSTINGTIKTDFTSAHVSVSVFGSRVLMFIFEESNNISEALEFYTNVATSYDREIRHKLREYPRYIVKKSFQIFSDDQYAMLDSFAKKSLTAKYNIPSWVEQKFFNTRLVCGSSSIDYGEKVNFNVNEIINILVYENKDNYDVVQLASISGNVINFRRGVVNNFNTYKIVPLYNGYIPDGFDIQNTRKYTTFDCNILTNAIPKNKGDIQFSKYGDYYVNDLYYLDTASIAVKQDIDIIDCKTGSFDLQESRLYNDSTLSLNFLINKSQLGNYKSFLFDCSGRLKPFWILSNKNELRFKGFNHKNYNIINIHSCSNFPSFKEAHIYLVDKDGTTHCRKIVAYKNTHTNNFDITLSYNLPSNIKVIRAGFLMLVRFNSDTLELKWKNSRTIAHKATVTRLVHEEKQAN